MSQDHANEDQYRIEEAPVRVRPSLPGDVRFTTNSMPGFQVEGLERAL